MNTRNLINIYTLYTSLFNFTVFPKMLDSWKYLHPIFQFYSWKYPIQWAFHVHQKNLMKYQQFYSLQDACNNIEHPNLFTNIIILITYNVSKLCSSVKLSVIWVNKLSLTSLKRRRKKIIIIIKERCFHN